MDVKVDGFTNTVKIRKGKESPAVVMEKLLRYKGDYRSEKMIYLVDEPPEQEVKDCCKRLGIEIAYNEIEKEEQLGMFNIRNMYK